MQNNLSFINPKVMDQIENKLQYGKSHKNKSV